MRLQSYKMGTQPILEPNDNRDRNRNHAINHRCEYTLKPKFDDLSLDESSQF